MTMANNDDYLPFQSDEYGMTNSEMDDTPPATERVSSRATDYWFGKRYFQCIIAQGVFEDLDHGDTVESADSSFEETLRNYPFRQAADQLKSLSPEYVIQGASDYVTLLTFLGMTVRVGEQRDKRAILRLIRECQMGPEANGTDTSSTVSQKPAPKVDSMLLDDLPQTSDDEGNVADLSIFTTLLKEAGDQENWTPDYRTTRYAADPRLFITTVSFGSQGYTMEGKPQRNQRLAKHSASQAAWEFRQGQRTGTGTSQASTRR